MSIFNIFDDQTHNDSLLGAVFTPLPAAVSVIEKFGLFEKWIAGATIFDPTAGEGNFLEAFVAIAANRGFSMQNLPIERLYGVEMKAVYVEKFFQKMRNIYGIAFPTSNFICSDFLLFNENIQADYLIGNPPWLNFTELPDLYKPMVKPLFHRYGLVANPQELLLGSSRIDFSGLIVNKSIYENLKPGGQAIFFLPMSLFLNDGANRGFRAYKVKDVPFATKEIYDYKNQKLFPNVATRYGLARFERNSLPSFPVPYYQQNDENEWISLSANPVFAVDNPLSITQNDEEYVTLSLFEKICIPKSAQPRQGVNTCGANEVFVFDTFKKMPNGLAKVTNKFQQDIILPQKYLFPLIATNNFNEKKPKARKWVLLPYSANGKALEWGDIETETSLATHLKKHEVRLKMRKGTMLQAQIKKGYWWAMLGVGPYCFDTHKIVWESFGKKHFRPILLSGNWQGNQAMHAFMPMQTLDLALETLSLLNPSKVQSYLSSLQMEGTCNWAQPGKMKKLITLF